MGRQDHEPLGNERRLGKRVGRPAVAEIVDMVNRALPHPGRVDPARQEQAPERLDDLPVVDDYRQVVERGDRPGNDPGRSDAGDTGKSREERPAVLTRAATWRSIAPS